MIKRIIFFSLFIFLFFGSKSFVLAGNDPTAVVNNKFGIHITNEKDLTNAASLVNSGGGDWGYVTFVITERERDRDRWQKIFDQMRRLHLIPIVRIATKANGETWEAPQESETTNWIAFLNSLNWVVQNRYVVIGNEPNHALEWGGKIDPVAYANYLYQFTLKLHEASPEFYVLPAGLDASAKNTKTTMDEVLFLKKMVMAQPRVFDQVDGWASHSYPNPDFSGQETDTGRGSIRTFEWELNYLKTLGITKSLPVFITETGWSNAKLDPAKIGSKYLFAFNNIWNDPRVIAVTPFILNYPQAPFSQFSWQRQDGSFLPYYSEVVGMEKPAGRPVQNSSGQIVTAVAQPLGIAGSDFAGIILVRNTGQTIWNPKRTLIASDMGDVIIENYSFGEIEPAKTGLIFFKAASPNSTGIYRRTLFLKDDKGKRITNSFPIELLITSWPRIMLK
jgi:hypothetical protein